MSSHYPTLTRDDILAIEAWTRQNRRAADAYYARDTYDDEPASHYDAGHPWTPERQPRPRRRPRCRTCGVERAREYRARMKAKRGAA